MLASKEARPGSRISMRNLEFVNKLLKLETI
uniref:Exodeoxyribonuclease VII small subunit n=1 Tax=Siphoviridae sp. ct96x5 TaxID=2825367 RepID=A0A8S5PSS2_9CAUD|nr:MAG TPA: exodeoxyribonuclease VII small subunit [Siphoviridae sp. ct96x5]